MVGAELPRQNIFVASTNQDHYFKDLTGNRRFWPVKLDEACDLAALRRDRDQLWAEAVVRYRQGECWYLTGALEAEARVEQDKRLDLDDWEQPILDYLDVRNVKTNDGTFHFVTSHDIITQAFHIENPILWTQSNTKRIAGILKRHGWRLRPVWNRDNTKQFKAFVKPVPTGGGRHAPRPAVTSVTTRPAVTENHPTTRPLLPMLPVLPLRMCVRDQGTRSTRYY